MNTTWFLGALHVLAVLCMPILLVGVVNRTKALWAGRRGPGLWQSAWDLQRLMYKRPVRSTLATPVFQLGPVVALAASLVAALVAPMLGAYAPLQFAHDFILFAYVLGLGRIFLTLSALDVGSSFEGMGAAREVSFTALIEPALFLLMGAASMLGAHQSMAALIGDLHHAALFPWLVLPTVVALLILLQVEAARVPVDDPSTHLELTMVHEVMVLDHSGPDLALMQYAAALKMALYAGLIATLLNPLDPHSDPLACVLLSLLLMVLVAVVVGCVESLVARLRLRWVPAYLVLASIAAVVCMALVVQGRGAA